MVERREDRNEEKEKENEGKRGKKRVKKGSKQDRRRNRKVVLWVLVVTTGISLIFYLSAWWSEREVGIKKEGEKKVEMVEEEKKKDDFMNGWGKPAVYEF